MGRVDEKVTGEFDQSITCIWKYKNDTPLYNYDNKNSKTTTSRQMS
jgi:hypothetical protein